MYVCLQLPQMPTQTDGDKEQDINFASDGHPKYSELREQYDRLQKDFQIKVAELVNLRVDLCNARYELEDTKTYILELDERLKEESEENAALKAELEQVMYYSFTWILLLTSYFFIIV